MRVHCCMSHHDIQYVQHTLRQLQNKYFFEMLKKKEKKEDYKIGKHFWLHDIWDF